MDFKIFEAGSDDNGRRLDRVIRKFLRVDSLAQVYKCLRNGLIKVNGKKQKQDYRVCSGDRISIAAILIEESKTSIKPNNHQAKPLDENLVLFRNQHLLFINKPYDLSVQQAESNQNALNLMVQDDYIFHHPVSESISFSTGPLHRLDRKTTGIICFSQSLEGARWFSDAIKSHEAKKTYLAVIQGRLAKSEQWSEFIEKNTDSSQNKVVKKGANFHTVSVSLEDKNGKLSLTDVEPLGYGTYKNTPVTLAKFVIHTGRTHQIRAVSSCHNHPLLGDTAYGGIKIKEDQDFYLHAWKLKLPENNLELPGELKCPVSDSFRKILLLSLINYNGEL